MTESIDALVAAARQAFARARDPDEDDRRAWILRYGDLIGAIGRRGAGDDPAVRALIAETAPRLTEAPLIHWAAALQRAAEPMTSDDDDYLYALALRSDVEFWKELYRDAAPDQVADMETDGVDEALAALAPSYYVAKVPADIPASHVWWHRHDRDAG